MGRPVLDSLGWLDVLVDSPFSSGDSRFLTRCFLPAHGRYRFRAYSDALAGLKSARSAEDLAARGRLRRILGDKEEARRDLAAALQRDARCADALAFRGEMLTLENPAAALADLDRALRLDPGHRPARLWRAYALACRGRSREALAELSTFLSGGPSIAGSLLRGMLRERGEDLAGAEEDYSTAIAAHPRSPGLFTLRAAVRCKRGNLAGAVADADRGLVLHPENLDGYVRILYLAEGLKTAIDPGSEKDILLRAADRILAKDPRCAWAHAARAGVLGRSALQLDGLRRAVALDPDNAWMRAFLGRALGGGEAASRREGLEELSRAARLAPEAGWMLCWRAEIRRQLKDFKGARSDLDKGLSLDPDYRLGFAWRAFLRDSRGDLRGAIADMTVCLEALPRTSFLHLRAEMRRRDADLPGALKDVASCMAQSTPHALAYGGIGWLSGIVRPGAPRPDSRRLMRARRHLRKKNGSALAEASLIRFIEAAGCLNDSPLKVIRIPAAKSGALWSARARLDAGKAAQALPLLDGVLRREPSSWLARAWRGEALCRLGRARLALRELDRALRLKPLFLPALLWRASALCDLGRRAEALSAVLSAYEIDPGTGLSACLWLRWRRPDLLRPRKNDGAKERSALAELALRAGRPGRARGLTKSLPLGRIPARGLLARGLARACLGDRAEAQSDLASAAERDAATAARLLPSLLKSVPGLGGPALALAYLALARAESSLGRAGEAGRLVSIARALAAAPPA